MEEDQELNGFIQSDHYQIALKAKPIIEKVKPLIPVVISWENITYGYLNYGITRTIARIRYYRNNLNGPIRILLNTVYRDQNLDTEVTQSLSHELAHLGAMRWKGYGESGHGFYWGYLMIAMGYEPAKSIDAPTSRKLHQARTAMEQPECIFADCPVCQEAKFFNMKSDYQYHCEKCNGTEYKI